MQPSPRILTAAVSPEPQCCLFPPSSLSPPRCDWLWSDSGGEGYPTKNLGPMRPKSGGYPGSPWVNSEHNVPYVRASISSSLVRIFLFRPLKSMLHLLRQVRCLRATSAGRRGFESTPGCLLSFLLNGEKYALDSAFGRGQCCPVSPLQVVFSPVGIRCDGHVRTIILRD